MRILVLENELTSRRGGQELSLLDVCRGLAARGHRISLAYVTPGDLEADYRQLCEQMVRVGAYSVDRSRLPAALFSFARSLGAVRRTAPDVIYANQYIDSLFAAATRRFLGAPFVCHLRLPPPDAWCTQFRIGMSQAQHLIATSEQTRREWLASGFVGSPISVVPNGIDPSRYRRRDSRDALRRQLGVTPGRLLITYAGRLHPAKGVEVLIEAAAQLARQRAIHLVVAGRPGALQTADGGPRDYPRELRAVAERVGIASAVTWIDHYRDVAALFSATDVAAVPSVWSEPFGRVAIESMACETPVVASRTGGIPEILTGEFADWMCEPGQAEALADRIACVADRYSADPGLGLRARAHVVRHFPIERTVDGIDRLLTSVARSGEPVAAAAASSSTS